MDWSWAASCRNRGQRDLRFPKRRAPRPKLMRLRRRLDEKPTSERTLGAPISSAPIGANFTTNGYIPVYRTVWNNSLYVVLSSQSDTGNDRILSYALDTNEHLNTPKESQISIPAPLVSIAAFPR